MALLEGRKIADEISAELRQVVNNLPGRKPCLSVILVGENPASKIYVSRKTQACEAIGIKSILRLLPAHISEKELLKEIDLLNDDPAVDGILVQSPLPSHVNFHTIINQIDVAKDVDGFHPLNVGKMVVGETNGFVPCTPLGIKVLLERSSIDVAGKNVVIFGRSNIVGKPLAALLMQNAPGANATVTVVHSLSTNIKAISLLADILVVAIGRPKFLTADMVKEGAVVIDVGTSRVEDPAKKNGYRVVGDVDFEKVKERCSYITPVPGGVGPMTIAMLLSNTLRSYLKKIKP
jgi:methylenetetrahydrofolate dehydrogenase (NADP+)/methenyltetrahydrofolate cyclohydrolase